MPDYLINVYTVQSGDTLSGIAEREYGDAMLYPLLFDLNNDVLTSPDELGIGDRLRLPASVDDLFAAHDDRFAGQAANSDSEGSFQFYTPEATATLFDSTNIEGDQGIQSKHVLIGAIILAAGIGGYLYLKK